MLGTDNLNTNFQQLKTELLKESKIIFSFEGDFNQDLINTILDQIEQLLISKGESKLLKKKMFSILLEGLQNIRNHAFRFDYRNDHAYMIIAETETYYTLSFANLMLISSSLESTLVNINKLSEEELMKTYLKELEDNIYSKKGGAGLGFMIMKLKSANNLSYSFDNFDNDLKVFQLTIKLSK